MANFTMELHDVIDAFTPPETLFDFTYPLFDPLHKTDLESKIVNHYYFHEIGFETPDRFKHQLSARMNEIMPKYNKMYSKLVVDVAVFSNSKTHADGVVDTTTNTTAAGTTNSGTDSTGSNESINLFSDTPQGSVDFSAPPTYVTEVRKDETESTSSVDTVVTDSNTGEVIANNTNVVDFEGYSGITESELLKIYMDNIYDVDMLIINNLADLFIQIY